MSMNKEDRVCSCGCGKSIKHKHVNAKFYNQKHKDNYHNRTNPRGKFAHLAEGNECEDPGDDMYWNSKE